jgi:hypothetical protein
VPYDNTGGLRKVKSVNTAIKHTERRKIHLDLKERYGQNRLTVARDPVYGSIMLSMNPRVSL